MATPKKPKDLKFDELVELVQKQLQLKPNEYIERFKFKKASQKSNETIADFVARLKFLSQRCNFGDLDTALRDQLIGGIRDDDTRIALFSEEKLTSAKALSIATTREAAVKNAASTKQQASSSGETSIKHFGAARGGRGSGSRGNGRRPANFGGHSASGRNTSGY